MPTQGWRPPTTPSGVGNGEDPASIAHQGKRFPNTNEKRRCLRIERGIPLLQGDIQGRLEKGRYLGPCVADEDVELPKLRLHLAKHVDDGLWTCDVGLHQHTIGPTLADFRERLFRGGLVLIVVNRELNTIRG
jgi:hypothetical protein